jgi:hypothetical protein
MQFAKIAPATMKWLRTGGYAPGEFQISSTLFLRALGAIYFSAFVSFGVQAQGLIGSHGILPLHAFIDALNNQLGPERYWLMPMVFWPNSSDVFIQIVCWGGAALSMLLVANILPRVNLFLLYAFYLSLMFGGQVFMSYQWDMLLIDAGFLGFLLSLSARPGIFLLRWLLFRFIFLSGVVKVASGDPSWRDFSALAYHFQTQPLPTPIAWYANHWPFWLLGCLTFMTLVIELVFPFFIFCGRRMRYVAAFGIFSLQTVIALTGNYNFFNLTVMALCLSLFDDDAFRSILPERIIRFVEKRPEKSPGKIAARCAGVFAGLILFATSLQLIMYFAGPLPMPLTLVNAAIEPLHVVNTYGPFAVMTKVRDEIILEGSDDSEHWKEYGFPYKPGDVMRAPPWNIPHQPRVDWQFWFAALEIPQQNPWLLHFMRGLLEGEPAMTALVSYNPFPDHPPKYLRAMFYDYRFTTPEERQKTSAWWVRNLVGTYVPEVHLR